MGARMPLLGGLNMARRSTILAVFAMLFALGLMVTAPAAGAGHPRKGSHKASDHDGDADSDHNTKFTEDNDTNDGGTPNNVEDEGDNRHPSGKDRSIERGGSGNQGKSESDPDDDGRGPDRSNGGPDKPNGSGGHDLADQDGNNGCGNDDDFEDDNEGNCGKPKGDVVVETPPGPPPCCEAPPEEGGNVPPPTVTPDVTERPEVLGTRIQMRRPAAVAAARQVRGGALPFTGAGVAGYVFVALAMIASGGVILRTKRS
jgi:hypothetical protein